MSKKKIKTFGELKEGDFYYEICFDFSKVESAQFITTCVHEFNIYDDYGAGLDLGEFVLDEDEEELSFIWYCNVNSDIAQMFCTDLSLLLIEYKSFVSSFPSVNELKEQFKDELHQ